MSTLTRIETVMHLQSVELCTYCSAEQVVRMASIARPQQFARRECIYSVDDVAESLFCLVQGQVELKGKDGSRRVSPPGTFGAREILSDFARAENATALEDCDILVFDGDDFFDLLSNNIEIVKALFRQLLRPEHARATDAVGGGSPS